MKISASWALGLALIAQPATQAVASAQPVAVHASQIPTPRIDYWQKRADEIDRQLKDSASLAPVKIVFVGDSITDFWHLDANPWFPGKFCGRSVWDESFGSGPPARTALNLGVSGDRIEHVLHRLMPAAQGGEGWLDRQDLRPDFVFVMLGINNSFDAEANPVEAISQGVEAVIDHIRQSKPGARIVIQSLLPTDDPIKNRDLVQPVNAVLRAYTLRTGSAHYLDLYPAFVDANGRQRRDLFNDGLHPSRDGYRVWRDQLVTYLDVR